MADQYYNGSDGDASNANNWESAPGAADNTGPPATNDDVYILGLDHAMNTGVSGNTGTDLASLTISVVAGGSIGDSGTVMDYAVSGTSAGNRDGEFRLTMQPGAGAVFVKAGTAGYDALHVYNRSGAEFTMTDGTATAGVFELGQCRVKGAATVTTAYNLNSTLLLESGAGATANLEHHNGVTRIFRSVSSTSNLYAGFALFEEGSDASGLNLYGNAQARYLSSNAIGALTMAATSRIDDAGNPTGFTVTTSTRVGELVSMFEKPNSSITYTNETNEWPLKV